MPNNRSAALRSRYAWARQAASQYRRPATESFGSRAPHRAQQRTGPRLQHHAMTLRKRGVEPEQAHRRRSGRAPAGSVLAYPSRPRPSAKCAAHAKGLWDRRAAVCFDLLLHLSGAVSFTTDPVVPGYYGPRTPE